MLQTAEHFAIRPAKKSKTAIKSIQARRKAQFTPLTAFQARKRRLGCDLVPG
jgi:hypothetical protein